MTLRLDYGYGLTSGHRKLCGVGAVAFYVWPQLPVTELGTPHRTRRYGTSPFGFSLHERPQEAWRFRKSVAAATRRI